MRSATCADELPSTWAICTVADLGEVATGTTPSTKRSDFYDGTMPFFKPTDLDAGYNVTSAREYLSEAGRAAARILPELSVLVTCIGATIGKTGLARTECATNQQINAVIPAPSIRDTRILYWFFQSPLGRHAVIDNASSTTLPILNKSRFSSLQVVVPPLQEQTRIVTELERYTSKLDAAVAGLKRVQANLKRYRASVLKAAVEGKLVPTEAALAKAEGRGYEPAHELLARILKERRNAGKKPNSLPCKPKASLPKTTSGKPNTKSPPHLTPRTCPSCPKAGAGRPGISWQSA